MMATPSEHRRFLQRRFAPKTDFPCTGYAFSDEEIALLRKYGYWLMALENGWIMPFTEAQSHFVDCCAGKARSGTPYERLWLKYVNSVRGEQFELAGREASDEDMRRYERDLEDAIAAETDRPSRELLERWALNAEEDRKAIDKLRER